MCNQHFCRELLFLSNSDCACLFSVLALVQRMINICLMLAVAKKPPHTLQCNKAREVHFRLNMKQLAGIFINSVEVSPCIIKQTCRKKRSSCTDVFHICCQHFCAARRVELVVKSHSEILNTFRVCLFWLFLPPHPPLENITNVSNLFQWPKERSGFRLELGSIYNCVIILTAEGKKAVIPRFSKEQLASCPGIL